MLVWSNVAPSSRPSDPSDPTNSNYNWADFDAQVTRALANQLTPIVSVMKAPTWAEGDAPPASAPPGTWKPKPEEVGLFGEAAAKRFQGQVRHWELWNEPNLPNFLNPQYEGGVAFSPRH
jgi:polysaccharide biosynthesis protein PslG